MFFMLYDMFLQDLKVKEKNLELVWKNLKEKFMPWIKLIYLNILNYIQIWTER